MVAIQQNKHGPLDLSISVHLSVYLSFLHNLVNSGFQDQSVLDAATLHSCSPASFASSPHLMTSRWLLYIQASHRPAR